jgi:integrase
VDGKRPSAVVFTGPNGKRWSPSNLYDRYWMNAVAAAMRCPEHPPPAPVKPPRGPTRLLRPDEVSTCGCAGVLQRRPRFHDCRHTHASACINKNWPVKKIQRRLGHASYSTTMDIYGHLLDHGDEGELESLEEFFGLDG